MLVAIGGERRGGKERARTVSERANIGGRDKS